MTKSDRRSSPVRDSLQVPARPGMKPDLPHPGDFPVGPKKKGKARKELATAGRTLDELQRALYAEGAKGGRRSVLLVLQGMDTSGKGGTVRHVLGLVDPMGVRYTGFGVPTEAERRHPYLWRIRKRLPEPGQLGVFDRSHYEDILVPRVRGTVPPAEWQRRYGEINEFEAQLTESGMTLLKVFLHISPAVQRERLAQRLTDPAKAWKYDPSDLLARAQWRDYQRAYRDVLRQTSTVAAPWYVVPADHKWYRNWAVAELLTETLRELAPRFPAATFDPAEELARLDAIPVPRGRS